MDFQYDPSPQRSPEWFKTKRGKIGASRLEDWLAVSKAKATQGKPLKARLDYERELMFERQFDVSYNNYVNEAMQDGIDFEDFAAQQYEKIEGAVCETVGCWYNDYFVASPDRAVGKEGLIEIKIVRDNTFTDVLMRDPKTSHPETVVIDGEEKVIGTEVPEKHWKQIQGQLWASGRDWCDYVCVNFNTKKVVIIRVLPDKEFHQYLAEAVQEKLVVEPFKLDTVYDIVGELPDWSRGEVVMISGAKVDHSDNVVKEKW